MLSWERISKHEAIDSPEGVRKRVKPSIASALQDSVVDLIEQKVPDAPAQEEGNNRKKQNHTDRHDPVAVDRDLPTAPPTRLLAHLWPVYCPSICERLTTNDLSRRTPRLGG